MKRCRLIYRSRAKEIALRKDTLDSISSVSQKNNQKDGIVGILLLSGNQFLQVLEGPIRYVNQLYKKILNDDRHEEVELVLYEQINTPYFFDWSMRLVDLNSVNEVRKQQLLKKYPHQDGALVMPDNLIVLYSLLHDARDIF